MSFPPLLINSTPVTRPTAFNAYTLLLFSGPISLDTLGRGLTVDGWLRVSPPPPLSSSSANKHFPPTAAPWLGPHRRPDLPSPHPPRRPPGPQDRQPRLGRCGRRGRGGGEEAGGVGWDGCLKGKDLGWFIFFLKFFFFHFLLFPHPLPFLLRSCWRE